MLDYRQIYKEEAHRKKARKFKLVILIVFFILLLALFFGSMHSSFLKVKTVTVRGTHLLNDVEVSSFIKSRITSSGFFASIAFSNDNFVLALTKKDEIKQALKEQYPVIHDVSIEFDKYRRSIIVDVHERNQYGIWCQESQDAGDTAPPSCWWFDEYGVLFIKSPDTQGSLIRKIIDVSDKKLFKGDVAEDSYSMATIREIFSFLDVSGLHIKTLLLKNRDLSEIQTYNNNYPTIYFSLRFDPSFALPGLQKINSELRNLTYIDLRVKNRVYYK